MPSPLAHSAMGVAIYRLWPWRNKPFASHKFPRVPTVLLAAVGLSLLPDFDSVLGIALNDLGSFHNNFVGSPFFGTLMALGVAGLIRVRSRSGFGRGFVLAFVCYQIHIIMDYFTIGRGVMLLWPLTSARFTSPFSLFYGLHWSDGLLTSRHLITLGSETGFVLLLFGAVYLATRSRQRDPDDPLPRPNRKND